ncbi:hypothetical protein CJ179_34565 [Rhodococcus sp. ACS1]|uniref:Uncharacterized protein n=1 Tax=Rhodococcus jostii TaxID=132919 RepID=A0A1H5LUG4_RHOJO|nr:MULTISPECIES: hypothetical protein [Rhodococcus]PBC39204.1 hypothetical protein CJ179_34565 [Rhodococcus sp. ACS1]SEE80041.1 hypothetical protein SAMN04490220_8386 [Rhodococcus jostii]
MNAKALTARPAIEIAPTPFRESRVLEATRELVGISGGVGLTVRSVFVGPLELITVVELGSK